MKKKISIGIFIFAIVLSIRLFFGVYDQEEYVDSYFFIKHRPTWKWRFYSPIGRSELKFEELSEERQIEQKYYNEFIIDQGISR